MPKYHHGDLRNTLIEIATVLLAEEGVHGVSLRKIAQQAGVSHNAPYMHFPDKESVLAAIAEAGFRLLAVEVQSAISQSGASTRQQLVAASNAYVNFAIDRANHLQVMFHPFDVEKYPSLLAASQGSLNLLFELVKSGQDNGELKAGDPHAMTKSIWAMVHGIATTSLALAKPLPEQKPSRMEIAHKTTSLLPEQSSTTDVVSLFVSFLLDGIAV
jgi:AcrR family transcriptional regulator